MPNGERNYKIVLQSDSLEIRKGGVILQSE